MKNGTIGEFVKMLAGLMMVLGALLACKGSGTSGSSGGSGKIGEAIKLDDSTWTVIEAKDLGKDLKPTGEFAEAKKTTGKFLQVHYKVTNTGKKQETLLETPKVLDKGGREFGHVEMESDYIPKGSKAAILETLQPSMEKDFYTVIEIPADASGLKLQLTGLGLLGEKKTIDLAM